MSLEHVKSDEEEVSLDAITEEPPATTSTASSAASPQNSALKRAKGGSTPRLAFEHRDAGTSKQLHAAKRKHKPHKKHAPEKHKKGGDYLKSFVYGGVDGIVTTFATVSGVSGANLTTKAVLVLGFANLVADGVAMGISDYISSKSEYDFAMAERDRELWECKHNIDDEKEEMVELYSRRGLNTTDAKRVVDILSKNHEHFVNVMMVEELGIMPPDPEESQVKMGLVTFISFVLFGLVPMVSYVFASLSGMTVPREQFNPLFISCGILTLGTLFVLGAITARFTSSVWWKSGGWLVVTGGAASAAAFIIGFLINEITGISI